MVAAHADRGVLAAPGLLAGTGADYVARGVSKSFGGVTVLRDVTIRFSPGEIHSVIGENGAGKSTLLKIMAGMYPADTGELVLDGKPLPPLSPRDAQRHGIYLVPQEPRLMPDLSVAENLYLGALPTRSGRVAWRLMNDTAGELIAAVGLRADPRVPAGRLSLAQQQLLECARALSRGCGTIFFDEPTSPLTAHDAGRLFEVMRQLRDGGLTLAFISHRLDEIEAISDRITVLRDGAVVARAERGGWTREGLVTAMIGRELTVTRRSRRTGAPGGGSPPRRTVQRRPGRHRARSCSTSRTWSRRPKSTDVGARPRRRDRRPCRARRQRADGVRRDAVRHPPGGGRHGQGERAGHHRRQPAHVHRSRADLPRRGPGTQRDLRRRGDHPQHDVGDHEPPAQGGADHSPSLAGTGARPVRPRGRWTCGRLDRRGDENLVRRQPAEGATRPLDAGQALVAIFDEPTRGVDIGAKESIYAIIESLAGNGLAALVISSELEELVRICDRVYSVYEGRVTGELAGDAITLDRLGELAVGA